MLFGKIRHAVTGETASKDILAREKQGETLSGIVLTDREVFFTHNYKRVYLPYDVVEWVYLQVAQAAMPSGKKGAMLAQYRVIYHTAGGSAMIVTGSKVDAERLMARITEANPNCVTGFTAENKHRFGME